jgi:oligosaccharyltransferase complex subunit beta
MARQLLLSLALLSGLSVALAGKSVLVLLQNVNDADKFSKFFGSLRENGFILDIKSAKDSSLKLREYGTWLYDDLVLFAPRTEGIGNFFMFSLPSGCNCCT